MNRRQRLVAGIAGLLIAAVVALVSAETTREWDDVGPTPTPIDATPFYRYLEMPPNGDPAAYPPRVMCNGVVAETVNYRGWIDGWFTGTYILNAGLYASSFRDYDRFRDLDEYTHQWGDWRPYDDPSIYADHWYSPAWTEQIYEPVTIEFTGRWVDFVGTGQDANSQDYPQPHTVRVYVVNSSLPGESYIWTDRWHINGRHLSSRALGLNPDTGPYSYSLFDNGQAHIRVGETTWVREHRHVRSYQVDLHECDLTEQTLDEAADDFYYYYAAVDNPGNGRDAYRSTATPGYYTHQPDHTGIAPGHMLDPAYNPVLTGHLAVCDAEFVHPAPPVPGQTAQVGYDLVPPQMYLCPVFSGLTKAVRLTLWDPSAPTYARIFESNATSDRFTWDGWFFGSNGTDPYDPRRPGATDYFIRVEWGVSDHFRADGQETWGVLIMTAEEDRVIVDVHAEGTDAPSNVREIAAGGVDNAVHRAIVAIYTNPGRWFTATVSMSGGQGIEPPVYQFLGEDYKLGEKVDARVVFGGQTFTAGDTQPIETLAWGSATGNLRSSNHEDAATVNIVLSDGLGTYAETVEFVAPDVLLQMPDILYPQLPDTTTVTLQLANPTRLVPGHELLFYVDGLTFKSGKHVDWMIDAYLRGIPRRLDRFVELRTEYHDPQYAEDITKFTDEDGLATGTIEIVEPLLGIHEVEVKILDGSVYLE